MSVELYIGYTTAVSYDADNKLFTLGEQKFDIHDEAAMAKFPDVSMNTMNVPINPEQQSLGALRLNRTLIATPLFQKWLQENSYREKKPEVEEIILDVFTSINHRASKQDLEKCKGASFMGFSMNMLRPEPLHLTFTTMGNCACLGAEIDGRLGQRIWEFGYAQYGWHNIDYPAQRVSLLAGIGHIASLANKSVTRH